MTTSLLSLAAMAAPACAVIDDDAGDEEVDLGVVEEALYANKDLIWPKVEGRTDIPVCWVNPSSAPGATAAARAGWRDNLRRAVEVSWARHARINFYGWDGDSPVSNPTACTSTTSTGIHIRICNTPTDSQCPILPQSQGGVAHSASGSVGFVRLNPTHGETVMVHEFGHALGLFHAEERPDAPPITSGPCAKQSFPNPNPIMYGAYDKDSVMSYCSPPTAAPWLSFNDVAGIQRAYTRRITGSMVTPRGNCAAAHHADGIGDPAFVWDCDEANRDQQFIDSTATSDGDAFSLYITGEEDSTKRCIAAASATAGAQVTLAACNTTNDWRFENMFFRGFGGRCLDLAGGNTTPGTPIQMWECGAFGGSNQLWTRTRSGNIRYGTSNSCARINPISNRLEIAACNSSDPQQTFNFAASTIKPKSDSASCLDVIGPSDLDFISGQGLLGNGAQLQLMPCKSLTLNQKFELHGGLRYGANGALCLARGADGNGSGLSLASCNGDAETQAWDFYF